MSAVFLREFRAYFATPIASVFLIIFLFSMGIFTFYIGHFYDNGVADLSTFFGYHPWLYLFLVPALAMRLWSEEKRGGTIELLLTLPVPVWQTVLGKFLAAWAFAGLALILTFPVWITVNYLGSPDNGVILASYLGSLLMAGAYLAISACISAATSNQVIAFVISVTVCFLFTVAGAPVVMDAFQSWAPLPLVESVSSFSFLTHFTAIAEGVIDLRDVIFFFSLIALFLFANVLVVEAGKGGDAMITRRTYTWSALVLATLLFFGLNSFAGNFFTDTRLDLTQSGQFTLADGTRAIIAKLPEPVTLRFYFSKKNSANYPVTAAYAKRVRDLLGEYASLAKGKIILEDVDPEPYAPEEDQANAAGIKPAPTQGGENIYFGLEGINSIDNKEVIPYFALEREPYLEYDLTSLLYQLSHPEKPKLAILSGLPLTNAPGSQNQPLTVYAQLQRDYAVTLLKPDFTAIPPGTHVLMLAHPGDLSPAQLRAIEVYAVQGGRTLVFIDPLSELVREESQPDAPPSSDLAILLKGWGVDYSPLKVVLDRALAQRIQSGADPTHGSIIYPLWLHLTADNFAPRDPVTASLNNLNLASVGALSPVKGATTHFEPLLWSSKEASLMSRDQAQTLRDPSGLMAQIVPTGKAFTIAARITGPASFPGVAKGNMNVIVVADTDIFDDRFWLRSDGISAQPFADNEGLILNAVENLAGSDDLISLRMRGNTDRPFTSVRAMQNDAELQFRETLQALQARLTASEQQIAQLQQGGGGAGTALTPEQTIAIEKARREIAGTRAELRDVQHRLRADIDRLGAFLAFLNILAVPLLVAAFAIVFGAIRRAKSAQTSRARAKAVA